MKKSIIFLTMLFSLMFASQANAMSATFGENSILWDWNEYPFTQQDQGYLVEITTGDNRDVCILDTVYNRTYKQENTIPGEFYSLRVKGLNDNTWSAGYGIIFSSNPAPRVINSNPTKNEINVPINSSIVIQFSKQVTNESLDITLKKGEQIIPINIRYQPLSNEVVVKSVYNLEEGVTYTVYLPPLTDLLDQTSEATSWSFTTYKTPISSNSDNGGSGGSSISIASTSEVPVTIVSSYVDIDMWAKDSIQTLVNKKILPSDVTNFYPNKEINRQEFVKLLILSMGYPTSTYTGKFTDVTSDNPNAIYIQTALDKGIIQGTSETTFSPDTPITREEIATMFDRALKLENVTPTEIKPLTEFKDYQQISPWAVESVQNMYSLGLIKGKTDFANVIIDGQANTTNAENATLLVRLLETIGK